MSTPPAPRHDIEELRRHLFETIQAVRAGTIDLDRARAVNELGRTLVDSARVEVAFLGATGREESSFLAGPQQPESTTQQGSQAAAAATWPQGINSVVQHRLGR